MRLLSVQTSRDTRDVQMEYFRVSKILPVKYLSLIRKTGRYLIGIPGVFVVRRLSEHPAKDILASTACANSSWANLDTSHFGLIFGLDFD